MWFLYLLGFITLLVYIWFKIQFQFWKRLGFPCLPGTIPFGSSTDIGYKLHTSEFLQREYEKFKNTAPAFGLYFFTQPVLVPTDPALIKEILAGSFETFHDHGFYVNEKADPLSINIFFTAGQVWKDLRAKLSPTFSSGKMKMMFPSVASHADEMVDYLKSYANEKKSLEMREIYASFTTEVISDVAFGLETKCLGNPDNAFRKMGRTVFDATTFDRMKIFFLQALPKLGRFLNVGFNRQETTNFFMGIVVAAVNQNLKTPLVIFTLCISPETETLAPKDIKRDPRKPPPFCQNFKIFSNDERKPDALGFFIRGTEIGSLSSNEVRSDDDDVNEMQQMECTCNETTMLPDFDMNLDGYEMDNFGHLPGDSRTPTPNRSGFIGGGRCRLLKRPPSPMTEQVIRITMNNKPTHQRTVFSKKFN